MLPNLTIRKLPGKLNRELHVYDFVVAGDEIPTHAHGEDDKHTTTVNRGKIRAYGPGFERVLSAGEIVAWAPGQEHALQALEAGSRLTNERY